MWPGWRFRDLLLPLLVVLAVDSSPLPRPSRSVSRRFPAATVRLLEGPFLEAQRRDTRYLLSLDPDRLLHTFRLNAGLPSRAKPLGGWEAPGGRAARPHARPLPERLRADVRGDRRRAARGASARVVTAELAKVQQALAARGSHAGYLSAFPESFFERLEARTERLGALLHDPQDPGGPARRASGHGRRGRARGREGHGALGGRTRLTAERRAVAGAARDRVRRDAGRARRASPADRGSRAPAPARLFDHRAVFDPLARGEDRLDGLHANTQIPKAIGAALDCQLTGEPRYCAVAETFWERVARHRSYVIGATATTSTSRPSRISRAISG